MTSSSLTNAQKEAINHFEGPILIVAGPGAGKTRILVERVLSLINNRNINPENILLTTFTVKAADELRARISKEIGSKSENVQISTIHSFCRYILEEYSNYHNIGSSFDILDNHKQLIFLRSNYEEIGINSRRIPEYIDFYNKCGENRIDPEELVSEIKKTHPNVERFPKVCESYKRYLKLLEKYNKIDYPGLQKYTLELLENNFEVLNNLREKYQFILVDEYQDTNPIQDKIFELIANPRCNICVVGDDDQSIYSFRGANIDNFLRFPKKYKDTKIITLKENFRSTANIIGVSEDFIQDYRYFDKKILPKRDDGNKIVLLKSEDEQDEAKKVVNLIKLMKKRGIIPHYGYVTLLFRSVKFHARKIITELEYNDIPFEVRGDGSFLKREEIRTMLYLLAYVDPPEYEKKFKSKWRDWWNISTFENEFLDLDPFTKDILQNLEKDFSLGRLNESSKLKEIGIQNEKDISKILQLNKLKKELSKSKKSLLELFYDIIKISDYLKRLIDDENSISDEKLFNLAKLSSIIKIYENLTKDPNVEDFLKFLHDLPRNMHYNAEILEDPHAIKLMTVHQAKGLEFPAVIVCSVVKSKFPMRVRKERQLVPIPKKMLIYGNEKFTDEERRIFYVALSRAQDNLIISTLENTNAGKIGLSPFISEDIGIEKFSDIDALIEKCEEREPSKNPTRISYSSINAYKNCPLIYKLTYFYLFEFISTYQQNYGTIIHTCLNRIHMSMKNKETITKYEIDKIVEENWIKIHNDDKIDVKRKQELKMKLLKYYEIMKDYIKEILSTEEPFSLFANGMLIAGRTDLIFKNHNDETELVDFKARGTAGITETFVETQLKVYEYGLKGKYNFDKLCAYQFEENKKTYFEPNRVDYTEISDEMENICKKIEMEHFEPLESGLCSQCFFKFCCR